MEYKKPEIIKLSPASDGFTQVTANDKPKHRVTGRDPEEKGRTNGGSHSNFRATDADPG